MAERFRDQVPIRPIDTRTGAAQGLTSLAQRLEGFKQFERAAVSTFAQGRAAEAQQRGIASAQEVEMQRADGITQPPETKEVPFLFGKVEAQAHNKALRSAYLASLDNDNREAIGRITAENPDNLINFNDQISSYRNTVIKNIDPSVRQLVQQDIDNKISTARIDVQKAEIEKQREAATAETELAAQSLLDESLLAARNGDLTGSAERLQDLYAVYDGQVESGIMTQAESQIKKRDAELKATRETIIGGVKGLMQQGKFNDAIEAIVKFREKVPEGFTIEEHEEVITAITSEVNESLSLQGKLEDESRELVKQAQQSKSVELFSGIISGTTTAQDVLTSLSNKQITQEQATKLTNTLNTRGKGIDEWSLVTGIQDGIRRGENMRDTIMSNAGTNLTEATAASLLGENDQEDDDESILRTSPVKRAEGFITQSMKVTGPFGSLDQEAEKRLAMARRNFAERVLDGEDEWDVADELVGKDEFDRAANPMFGNKQNLDKALELLGTAHDSEQIDDDTYNFEFNKAQRLIQLRDNIQAFDKSRKDALNGRR